MENETKHILLFASGGGSNVDAILNYFRSKIGYSFPLIITNNPKAGVFSIAQKNNVDVLLVDKSKFNDAQFIKTLQSYNPDLLVLAGFLWKIPASLVAQFPNKIINIHPALLPAYGGKGMYGHHVHEAVVSNKEKESGITIHYVNEHYDEGAILLQQSTAILPEDSATIVAAKVLKLEHEWYPKTIEHLLSSFNK